MADPVATVNPFRQTTLPPLTVAAPSGTPSGNKSNPFSNLNGKLDTTKVPNFNISDRFKPIKDEITNLQSNVTNTANTKVTSGDIGYYKDLMGNNQYETDFKSGLDRLNQYSQGKSEVDKMIADGYLTRFDASMASAAKANAQRIANNPYLTTGAKSVAVAEQMRQANSQRAGIVSGLAVAAQERAYEATKSYTELSLSASSYEQGKFKDALGAAETAISRKMQGDLANLDAAIKKGDLTVTEATMEWNKIDKELTVQQQNFENDLSKQKAIAEFDKDKEQSALIQEQVIAARDARVTSYKTSAYSILSAVEEAKGSDITLDDVKNDQMAMSVLTSWFTAEGGDVNNKDQFDAWLSSVANKIETSAQVEMNATLDKIKVLRDTYVKDAANDATGWMDPKEWESVENNLTALITSGGAIRPYTDPKTGKQSLVFAWSDDYLTDADGNMITIGDSEEETDTSYKNTLNSFKTWKDDSLLDDDTVGYTDDQVYNKYRELYTANGKAPSREELISSLKEVSPPVSDTAYTDIQEKLSTLGADANKLTSKTGKEGKYMTTLQLSRTEIQNIIEYERANPDKSSFVVDDGLGTTVNSIDDMENAIDGVVGKVVKYKGGDVIFLGMSDTKDTSNKNRHEYQYYNVATGKTETVRLDEVMRESYDYSKKPSYAEKDLKIAATTVSKGNFGGLDTMYKNEKYSDIIGVYKLITDENVKNQLIEWVKNKNNYGLYNQLVGEGA